MKITCPTLMPCAAVVVSEVTFVPEAAVRVAVVAVAALFARIAPESETERTCVPLSLNSRELPVPALLILTPSTAPVLS